MSYVRFIVSLFAVPAFVGCAHRPAMNSNDQFVLDTQTERIEARIDPNGINGPMIQVGRFDSSSLKGIAFNRPVFMHWGIDRASGLVAGRPVELSVQRNGGELLARGLSDGSPVNFVLSSNSMAGIVRGCNYWLKGSPGELQGFRQCGLKMQEPTSVYLPQTLQAEPDAEKIAVLTMLLSL